MSETVGAYVLKRLHEHGVERIYGYPGDGINGILGGFHEHGEDIEFDEDAKRLSLQTLTLAELLQRHAPDWEAPRLQGRALVHGHCHQEAVMGMSAEKELYERLGLDFEVLDSGCCVLAGSFGIAMALPRHR